MTNYVVELSSISRNSEARRIGDLLPLVLAKYLPEFQSPAVEQLEFDFEAGSQRETRQRELVTSQRQPSGNRPHACGISQNDLYRA